MSDKKPRPDNLANQELANERKAAFLEVLQNLWPNVYQAARSLEIPPRVVYHWKTKDKEFAEKWEEIVQAKMDEVESGLLRDSSEKWGAHLRLPVLKAYRPERWGDRSKVEHSGGVNYTIEHSIPAPASWTEDEEQPGLPDHGNA